MNKLNVGFGLVLLATAGFVGTKLYIADKAEEIYLEQFAHVPENSGLVFEQRSFETRLGNSTAVTAVKFETGNEELDEVTLVVTTDIAAGPVFKTKDGFSTGLLYTESTTEFEGVSEDFQVFLSEHLNESLINMTSLIDFSKNVHSTLDIPSFSVANEILPDGQSALLDNDQASGEVDEEKPPVESFEFGGLSLTVIGDMAATYFRGDIKVDPISFKSPEVALVLPSMSGEFDYEQLSKAILLGESVFNVPSVAFNGSKASASLNDIEFKISSTLGDDDKLDVSETIRVGGIESALPVTAASYTIEFNNLPQEALERWHEVTPMLNQSVVQQAKLNSASKIEPDATKEGVVEASTGSEKLQAVSPELIQELIEKTAQPGLELNQEFTVDAFGGQGEIILDVRFVGLQEGLSLADIKGPAEVLPALDITAKIEADREALLAALMLIEIDDAKLDQLPFGMVNKGEEKYSVLAELKEGALMLNGNQLPPELVNDFLMQATMAAEAKLR